MINQLYVADVVAWATAVPPFLRDRIISIEDISKRPKSKSEYPCVNEYIVTYRGMELFLVDINGDFSDIDEILKYFGNSKYSPLIHKIKAQSKKFDWSDDVPINRIDCNTEGYNKFFDNL